MPRAQSAHVLGGVVTGELPIINALVVDLPEDGIAQLEAIPRRAERFHRRRGRNCRSRWWQWSPQSA